MAQSLSLVLLAKSRWQPECQINWMLGLVLQGQGSAYLVPLDHTVSKLVPYDLAISFTVLLMPAIYTNMLV